MRDQRVRDAGEFGKILRSARKELGVTQADVAAIAGVSVKFVSQLERGKESAELDLALRVLSVLGLEARVGFAR